MLDLRLNLAGEYKDAVTGINVAHGDFSIRNGKFSLVPEDDTALQLGQRLHVRLLLRKGEVFFNTEAGFPYTDLGRFKQPSSIFDTYMKSYILATDGVTQLKRFNSVSGGRTRVQQVDFEVVTGSNQILTLTQEVDV